MRNGTTYFSTLYKFENLSQKPSFVASTVAGTTRMHLLSPWSPYYYPPLNDAENLKKSSLHMKKSYFVPSSRDCLSDGK